MVMEIIRHTSLYWEKQIISLAISFLDILIAMGAGTGRAGFGELRGRTSWDLSSWSWQFWPVAKYFLPPPQAQLGNQEQQNPDFLAKCLNGALSPTTRCRLLRYREKRLFKEIIVFSSHWDGQFLLAFLFAQ